MTLPPEVQEAADAGFAVVPADQDKKPKVRWRRWVTGEQTPADRDQLGHGSLWAVITGERANVVVLDFDGPDGLATLETMGLEPDVRTPSGAHVYVTHPSHPVKSSAKKFDAYPGLDIKGDKSLAYFLGRSKKGKYEPVNWPPFPQELGPELTEELFPPPQVDETTLADEGEWTHHVAEADRYLVRACQDIVRAPVGTSNAVLNKAAFTCGGLVASGQLRYDDTFDALLAAAETRNAENPATVISSSMEAGADKPWAFDLEPAPDDDGEIWVPSYTLRLFNTKGVPDPVAYPTEALPYPLNRLVADGAKALSCPPEYIGTALLPALGTAIGGHVTLEISETWTESACIWSALVGKPGTLKSPAMKLAMTPVWEAQDAERSAAEEEARRAADDDEYVEVNPPRIAVDDATIEALFRVHEKNPRGLILAPDELAGWVKGMGQYKGGLGRDRQHWLSIWSRNPVTVDRVKSQHLYIKRPFVCVTGGIQAEPLEEMIHGVDDGLLPRLLLAHGEPGRRVLSRGRLDMNLVAEYHDLWNDIRDRGIIERTVRFTPAGYDAYEAWVNDHYEKILHLPEELLAAWSKMDGQCARIALVLAEVAGTEVTEDVVARAIALVRYYQGQAAGLLQGTSSQSAWEKKNGARTKMLGRIIQENPGADRGELLAVAPSWALADPKAFDRHLESLKALGIWQGGES